MLLREDRGGHEDGDLFAALDDLEGGADGDLGFAKADVAADETIHRAGALEVGFGGFDGGELVLRFGEGERALEFLLPVVIGRERVAGLGFALGLNFEEVGGEIDGGALGGLAGFFPAVGADFTELGFGFAEADVAADEMRLLKRDVEGDAVVEFEGDDFALAVACIQFRETAVEGDAVLEVDNEIAFDEFGEVEELVDLGAGDEGALLRAVDAARALAAEEFGFGDEDESADLAEFTLGEGGPEEAGAGAVGAAETLVEGAANPERLQAFEARVFGEDLFDALLFAFFGDDKGEAVAVFFPGDELGEEGAAGLFFGGKAFLRDEVVGRVGAVMDEAFGVPGGFGDVGAIEERSGFVNVGEAEGGGGFLEDGGESVETLAGEGGELLVERGGFDEDEMGVGRQVVGDAGGGRAELEARGGGEGDGVDLFAGALGDGVEGADVLDVVAEEIEAVGRAGGDGVDVDDAAADRVVSGGFADGLAVVVERLEGFEEGGEGLVLSAGEGDFARGEFVEGGDGLEECGGGA